MAVWELALVILALTYMMVNTVYLIITVKMMNGYKGIFNKSVTLLEKMLDKSDKAIDELYED